MKITAVKLGDYKGQTPLTLAMGRWWTECPPAETGKRVEVVRALLDARVDVNLWGESSDPKSSQPVTGLMQACLQGSVECVNLLLAANAQIDAKNSTLGNTALHLAAQYGIYLSLSLSCVCPCQCLCVCVQRSSPRRIVTVSLIYICKTLQRQLRNMLQAKAAQTHASRKFLLHRMQQTNRARTHTNTHKHTHTHTQVLRRSI